MQQHGKKLTVENCKDSGLALVLICLICYLIWHSFFLIVFAITSLVVAMTLPLLFKPFARVWFGLSTAIGTVVSKIILTMLFFGVVCPIGLLRRAMGKDSMRLRLWHKGQGSVFCLREHRYSAKDLEHPY